MKLFNPNLLCPEHNLVIDVYCKNPICKIEDRLCCNTCAQTKHPHQTTRIWELQNIFEDTIKLLSERIKKFNNYIDQIKQKAETISSLVNKDINFLRSMIENFENQTLTNIIKAQILSTTFYQHKISQRVTELIQEQPNTGLSISYQTINYVKLLNENKKDEAIQVLQELIKLDQNNEIYQEEMKRIANNQVPNIRPQNIQENAPDINHLVLQYKCFLLEDKNEKEALKVLDQILEFNQENYIYQRERQRITHEIVEYSIADDRFFNGQYLNAAINCDQLLQIRQDPRIFYQKGLSLFYLKNYDQALGSIEQSIEKDIENIQYKITKCQLLFARKDLENLKVQAMDLKSFFDSINLVIEGQILILQNEYQKAREIFEQAIQINYFQFEAHFLKALCVSKILQSTKEVALTPQQILQNESQNQPLDMQRFQKFYCMYLENYKFTNNPLKFSDDFLEKIKQIQMQTQKKKQQAENKIGLEQ